MSRKRVVVTGLSALTSIGNDVTDTWDNLLRGKSGIAPITLFDAGEFDTRIAGEVKNFNPENFGIPPKQAKRMARFVQFGVAAALMLLKNSRYAITEANAGRIASIVGVGLGGLETIEQFHTKLISSGPGRVSPFFIPMLIPNMVPGQISIFTGAKGPNLVITSACASGLHAIGAAYTEIVMGRADAAITGGVEATITPMGISGFTSMKAMSTRNDEPEKASRPFDKNRDGFVMGEGAGLLLLEDLESAKKRDAVIYAEVLGCGSSADAYHMVAPKENGEGMIQAMLNAVHDAGITVDDIDHINAHATSTQLNDTCETLAIKTVFGERAKRIPITANKSQIGHLLGAAGGIESLFSVLALHHGIIPGTINYETPDPSCDLDYVTQGPRKTQANYALCNNFGFGGTNASMVFKRWSGD
ncbi:MAG: beta-ketoacyl-ACP synthase II [Deltaproteobacteria bacterium]|jgi:3-oxoacyl-[acyl-carrier-protein] synthase II|nr:beta-ketoacyl-ACP synthase II [Deltaproteobacteria bacterium]